MFSFSKTSQQRMAGVDSRLSEIASLAIRISIIDFGIPQFGGLRTIEDQAGLHKKGLSKCDGVINKSFHQTGKALDVYAYVNGKASWKREHLALVAAAMLQSASTLGYKLEWGGLWPWDMPHFQIMED
jgi:peptidoglycan L-alanyl-D-glutamate endopeptidase CwlK